MRIVIDLQGAQSESRFRGIGRYSLALALGVARNAGAHEVWLALNGSLGEAIEDLRQAFAGLVPAERICVFDVPRPAAELHGANSARARAGELLREHAIAQLRPDAVLVTSLFEGYVDDAVVSAGRLGAAGAAATAVVLYDLIPLLDPQAYLAHPGQRAYYDGKIASLRRAGLLLAISEHSRREAIEALGLAPDRVVTISTAIDDCFRPAERDDPAALHALRQRFGLRREVLMYAPGGFDARKNVDGLITAYSLLPPALRAGHQLLVASKIADSDRHALEQHARRRGLAPDELVLTGYVDDATLVALYRACALFVFPSRHEGFGLPALEAMACGAPVIGADNTSIPEVIGCAEALFDAADPAAIAAKIAEVLGDPALHARLRAHGRAQARRFSWDITAQRTLRALEADHAAGAAAAPPPRRRKLAFVSPMPPEKTGVADYAVRVLPTLLADFDVELVVQQPVVTLPPELRGLVCRDAAWLQANGAGYDHIVYQFGNSPFHSHMLALLDSHPGVVVLHDFFLSSMLLHEELSGAMPGVWPRALWHAHGYAALRDGLAAGGQADARDAYPANLAILQQASHVIVHSDYARQLARQWYGPRAGGDWSMAQLPRAVPAEHDRDAARRALGIAPDTFLVCNFGFVAPTKHCLELLQAWLASSLHAQRHCHLVFVGANHGGDYGRRMSEAIAAAGAQERVRISGWTSDDDYLRYLQAADLAVQLRTISRGETSGTVLDCMIYRLPTIINANGAMAEFPPEAAWMLPDLFSHGELVEALETLYRDDARRGALGRAAFALMGVRNSPQRVGRMYRDALDLDLRRRASAAPALLPALLDSAGPAPDDATLREWARCLARAPDALAPRQLLVDVTAIARHDLRTGIERVVRTQLLELLGLRACGWRVEPVYLSDEGGGWHYRYARRYAASLLGLGAALAGPDAPLDLQAGDVFYSADHSPHAVLAACAEGVYANLRARGVGVNFLVHDLLPVLRPEFFPPHADRTHAAWLAGVAGEADRLICISAAVADETRDWLERNGPPRRRPLELAVLHHGADIDAAAPAPAAGQPPPGPLSGPPVFLMVGTIEPRKGHLQALDAFELLWRAGLEAQLVIVGAEGWTPLPAAERRTIPAVVQRLREHPELGRRLHWLQGLDDGALQQLYRGSACLLQPSEGEGFGLPLIEAASFGLPVLARDIPVFREVGRDSASYFSGLDGQALADAVRDWLALHAEGRHPPSSGMPRNTWRDNVLALLAVFEGGAPRQRRPAAPDGRDAA